MFITALPPERRDNVVDSPAAFACLNITLFPAPTCISEAPKAFAPSPDILIEEPSVRGLFVIFHIPENSELFPFKTILASVMLFELLSIVTVDFPSMFPGKVIAFISPPLNCRFISPLIWIGAFREKPLPLVA